MMYYWVVGHAAKNVSIGVQTRSEGQWDEFKESQAGEMLTHVQMAG